MTGGVVARSQTCRQTLETSGEWRVGSVCYCCLSTRLGLLQRPKLITDEWQKVLDLQAKGEVLSGTIKAVNRGGVVVEVRAS